MPNIKIEVDAYTPSDPHEHKLAYGFGMELALTHTITVRGVAPDGSWLSGVTEVRYVLEDEVEVNAAASPPFTPSTNGWELTAVRPAMFPVESV